VTDGCGSHPGWHYWGTDRPCVLGGRTAQPRVPARPALRLRVLGCAGAGKREYARVVPTADRSPTSRFDALPKPIRLEDTIASLEVREALDPEAGRDTDRDFLLRYN
jgi:hypothetical protein